MKKIRLLNIIIILFFSIVSLLTAQRWEKVTAIPQPYINTYWLDVYFLPSNPDYGWVCGFNGHVIRTNDGGKNWTGSTVPGGGQLESIHFPSAKIGYTSGTEGIFKSIVSSLAAAVEYIRNFGALPMVVIHGMYLLAIFRTRGLLI